MALVKNGPAAGEVGQFSVRLAGLTVLYRHPVLETKGIVSGSPCAVNVATNPKGRPRYLIDLKDVEAFEARRSVHKTPSTGRRRKPPSGDVIEFFR